MGSYFRFPQEFLAAYTNQESYRRWSSFGIFALAVLVMIAVLFIIAGMALAKYWFLPKIKRMCIDRCYEVPLKVGDSKEGNHGATHSDNVEIAIEAGTSAESLDFSIQMLRGATGNFCDANFLEKSISGTIYRGNLCNGMMVSVQRLHVLASCIEDRDEFEARISSVVKVRHMQLVTLLGYCIDGSDVYLVYENIAHLSSLSKHLFAWKELGLTPLSWATRLNIALDVAKGLDFLHGISTAQFIHGFLNASNVLLNDAYRAKVSDFGLLLLKNDLSAKTSLEADISEYLPPEYDATGSSITKKTDVFSFGLLLMELIMGSKALDMAHAQGEKNWTALFKALLDYDDDSSEFRSKYVDEAMVLVGSVSIDGIGALARLASCCIRSNPTERPKMSYMVNVLSSLIRGLETFVEETEGEDANTDVCVFEALKKWQALDEASMDSETFQAANSLALKSSRPESTEESENAKEMDTSGPDEHTNHCKASSSEAESQSYCQDEISGPVAE